MLEKNSSVVLTDDDLKEYKEGRVSKRVRETWEFSLEELKEVVESGNYNITKTKE